MFVASYTHTMRNARPKASPPKETVRTIEQIREEKRAIAVDILRKQAAALAEKIEQARLNAARDALSAKAISLYRVIDIREAKPLVRRLIEQVAVFHGVSYDDIVGPSRTHKHVAARFDAIRAVHDARPDLSLPQLGRHFARDHTSILYALSKAKLPGEAE